MIEKHGVFTIDDYGVNRWVCNHCGIDICLDERDISEHLEINHEEELKA